MRVLTLALLRGALLIAVIGLATSPVLASEPAPAGDAAPAAAEPAEPGPPKEVQAAVQPDDAGGGILVSWEKAPHEAKLKRYIVYRAAARKGPWQQIATLPPTEHGFHNNGEVILQNRDGEPVDAKGKPAAPDAVVKIPAPEKGKTYWFRVEAWDGKAPLSSVPFGPPGPPTGVKASDTPNDTGGSIVIEWQPAPHDGTTLKRYVIYRAESPDGPWRQIKAVPAGILDLEHSSDVVLQNRDLKPIAEDGTELPEDAGDDQITIKGPANDKSYWFKVEAWDGQAGLESTAVGPIIPDVSYFHTGRVIVLFAAVIFIGLLVAMIMVALSGRELYIRPIAGIQAVEEAIGRATEMGRPILFVPGLSSIQDVATLAALNVLGPVAEKAAEYDTKLLVPNRDAIVFTVAQEIVREAHSTVGRPDSFDEKNVYFVSDQQFAYAAAVQGLMVREKPATNFLLGMFWAESLLLAETGNTTGAIQIAGTDAVTQLPFFIVACDYTLIGEELYAAGAYMGKDPKLTGSLKGQDLCKAAMLLILLLGLVLTAVYTVTDRPDLIRDLQLFFRVKN